MVIVLEVQEAETPGGNPEGDPIPVAKVVVCVMFGITVLTHLDGDEDAALTVFDTLDTMIVPEALTEPHLLSMELYN